MRKKFYIKENSFRAKCGAKILKVNSVALTMGNTIYLYNATKNELLNNKIWLTHELVHIQQYEKLGIAKFLFLYIIEWIRKGYYNISFEIEARTKENNIKLIDEYEIQ